MSEPKVEEIISLALKNPDLTIDKKIQLLEMLKELTLSKRQQRHEQKIQELKVKRLYVPPPEIEKPVETVPMGKKVGEILDEYEKDKKQQES